jgi:hypothetical protein
MNAGNTPHKVTYIEIRDINYVVIHIGMSSGKYLRMRRLLP